ncbi:DEAD/DEAH box helicase [Butyrivibrio proteoclasticus]|uniref:DEAD/DEAH box helicase n=1 Tax=Butyrivibrio proteoclasticus TaxID=43305 RepID=UPI00068867F3|nr:SNF2-related protein [Butyrivibrio proteoclasticus]
MFKQTDGSNEGFISASGRRFVSDAPKEFHYTSFETKKLLRTYSKEAPSPDIYKKTSLVELIPHVLYNRDRMIVSFVIRNMGNDATYVLKDIAAFMEALDNQETISYGKHLTFTHDLEAFSSDSQKIIAFLQDYFREKKAGTYTYSKGHAKQLELSGFEIDDFFLSVKEIYFLNGDYRARYSEERLLEKDLLFPPIDLRIEKIANGISFENSAFTMFEGHSYVYFERRRKLHMLNRSDIAPIMPFLSFIKARRTENELFVAEKDLVSFTTGLLPVLNEYLNVNLEGFDPSRYSPDVPKFDIYIDMPDSLTISCMVKAIYKPKRGAAEEFNVFYTRDFAADTADKESNVKRDIFKENRLAKQVSPYFESLDSAKGLLLIKATEGDEDKIYNFITNDIPVLSGLGDIFLSESIKEIKITRTPRISFGVSVVADLLQLSIVPEDLDKKELDEILNKYNRRKKYFRLKSGEILDLSSKEMDLLFSLRDGLMLTKDEIYEGHVSVPGYRALFLEDIWEKSREFEGITFDRSKDFKALIESFSYDFKSEYEVPESLKDVLRDYQKKGFYWLLALKKNGFGGILADDMGLGKTLQVLAFLLALKKEREAKGEKPRCSLIVCPASLVYNWQHEIMRFTKELSCELAVGLKPDRVRVTSEIEEEETDVIITSYDLLRRDIELYKYLNFECMVIDEAQFIKNSSTLVAKSVKSIKAGFKVALTGTPIENRLSELWSIFDYCMPGYLFNYKTFKERIEVPVVSDGDEEEMEHLKRMVAPFVLRRLKKDVLKDLPDKIEEDIYAQMTKEQEALYKAYLQNVKMMVSLKSDDEVKKDRIAILSEITRLRQICCDPGLVYDNYVGDSAKLEVTVEMLKSATESGHKVLLFSQFTSMLDRITKRLEQENISFYLLTGQTKKEDRISMVEAFKEDDTKVFCISLKAGGTGLNLTAADIVIHYDHWWNVAVQNQATDRAHRIGQKNVVTVYKIIMKDTIEERIIQLQNRKKELSSKLLDSSALSSPDLSREELLKILG